MCPVHYGALTVFMRSGQSPPGPHSQSGKHLVDVVGQTRAKSRHGLHFVEDPILLTNDPGQCSQVSRIIGVLEQRCPDPLCLFALVTSPDT